MRMLLISGLWLDTGLWGDVLPKLQEGGNTAVVPELPGQHAPPPDATLADQVAAVLEVLDETDEPTMVVGHSAASTLALLVAEQRSEQVPAVVYIGGMPQGNGEVYVPWIESSGDTLVFPGWEVFAGPDSDDLTDAMKDAFVSAKHSVGQQVANSEVSYLSQDRYEIPAYLICPEFTPEDVKLWIGAGNCPELEQVKDLRLVDLRSGHWPMLSVPDRLADLLNAIAQKLEADIAPDLSADV